MFENTELSSYIKGNQTIHSKLKVVAEWNLNTPDNLEKVGNYRFRPAGSLISQYESLNNTYDPYDVGQFYTDATNSDIALDGVNISDDAIEIFSERKDVETMLFSLEDCFGRFRPRSGINKIRYGITKFLHHDGESLASRPRYYMPDKNDTFKYWTSYRNESTYLHAYSDGTESYSTLSSFYDTALGKTVNAQNLGSSEYGIASKTVNNINYIDDAAPFVVYKNEIPANRIIVKMQTNVGETDLGTISSSSGIGVDPLYDSSYKTTPSIWKIQYLKDNVWIDAISFDQFSIRSDGSDVISSDGYVEVAYGAIVPEQFSSSFVNMGTLLSQTQLPLNPDDGDAYLIKQSNGPGKFYVAQSGAFSEENSFVPTFGWTLVDDSNKNSFLVSSLVDPESHFSTALGEQQYTEFVNISGLRVVVTAMKNKATVFDLIELSPRLVSDVSDMVASVDVVKNMSDLGNSGLPVGQLLASVGSISLFDSSNAFNPNNTDSIVKDLQTKNIQFKIYESIKNNGVEYDIPIKVMYADGIPATQMSQDTVSIELRDLFFYFESLRAPEVFATNVSLSYAVSLLLDSVGFSNYTFKRLDSENDPIIPYFYTSSQSNVADILGSLAVSAQYAMYFDEYNNLVVASRGYIMPTEEDRATDHTFRSNAVTENGETEYPDIIDISSITKNIFTGGELNYTTRYIQKSEASAKQTYMLAKDKTWVYKPSLLWEVSAPPNVRASNEPAGTQAAYTLAAIPLNSNLSAELPTVVNREIINNVLDLGEGIYWLGRYSGYLYSNAEIIKFDAIEYSVSGISGNVWISSVDEYQYFFSKLPFSGKIYPTGRVRIFCEPYYEEYGGSSVIKNGEVRLHGRAQFGTSIAAHYAGLNSHWSNVENVYGFSMESEYLFSDKSIEKTLSVPDEAVGAITPGGKSSPDIAKQSKRSGMVKNYIANFYDVELDSQSSDTINNDMIQSSALVIEGPDMSTEDAPEGFITYVSKTLTSSAQQTDDTETKSYKLDDSLAEGTSTNTLYKHFGTRMRIIGELKDNTDLYQSASGATAYYDSEASGPTSEGIITGGGGGIACMLNKETNIGYYFEIAALDKGTGSYDSITLDDVFFYKIYGDDIGSATPLMLWSGSAGITVDSGRMVGQSRVFAQEVQTVYDLALEYVDSGETRTFYLYLNGTQIATVVDDNPLPVYSDMSLFVRGSSKCMFENVYALKYNYSKNPSTVLDVSVNDVFGTSAPTVSQSFNKYAISGIVQQSFLSGISTKSTPDWGMYYEEFGTIMREVAHFDIKYDKAYPALYSKIAPTGNEIKGYVVSGYRGTAYGAEFLVFNATDTTITLDENSGNFLKIQGIAFTQNTAQKLTVDDYFNITSDLSPSTYSSILSAGSELRQEQSYTDIKALRRLYGVNEFSIQAEYIQTQDQANQMMSWLANTIMKPRLSVGLSAYANPMIQLGDIVAIDYTDTNGETKIDAQKRFVVYSIEYSYSADGPSMNLYLSEVD